MAAAKQQTARRMLYSIFFRGPILGNDLDEKVASIVEEVARETDAVEGALDAASSTHPS